MHLKPQIRNLDLPDFQVAVLVKKNVARLQVTMNDVSRVQELECSQNLVDKILNVFSKKLLP